MTDRELLLSFIGSLTLCDHMGDVSDDIYEVLQKMGEKELVEALCEQEDFDGLQKGLEKRGVKTLYGTTLWHGDDE